MHWATPRGYRVCPPDLNITREVLDRQIAAGKDRVTALVWEGGAWTYADLNREVCRIASGFRTMGVEAGDIVLFRSRNIPENCAAILAAYKIGAVTALTSTLLSTDELEVIVDGCRPRLAVTQAAAAPAVRALAQKGKLGQILLLDSLDAGPGEVALAGFDAGDPGMPTRQTSADDPAILFYSSGTTGKPKGVLHAHRWICSMGDIVRLQMEYRANDVVMTPGEFSFMATWGHCLVGPLYSGATVGLFSGRPSPRAVLEAIAAFRVNKFMSVPTFYRTLLATPGAEHELDLGHVEIWVSGGEALGETAAKQWNERFGTPLHDMYGISEMQVVVGSGPGIEHRPGSVGKVFPGVNLTLRDDALNEVAVGEPGRVMIHRSDPGLFLEYYGDWDKWRSAHRGDYYDTGDVMRRDADGYHWYIGREDDLFKSRGMFISPGEIEDVLARHPIVAEAAVIGVPDERVGFRVEAFVVLHRDAKESKQLKDDLLSFARQSLANYKVPEYITVIEALPKNVVGKVLRRELRAMSS